MQGLGFRYGNRFGYEPLRQHLVKKLADFAQTIKAEDND